MSLLHICDALDRYINYTDDFIGEWIYDEIPGMTMSINESVAFSSWKWVTGEYYSQLFVPVLTEVGLCFAFNAVNSREIYTDQ